MPKSTDIGVTDNDGPGSGTVIATATFPLPPSDVIDTVSLYAPDFRSALFAVIVTVTDSPDVSDPLADDNESHACCLDACHVSVPPPVLLIVTVF